jgi:hypothetical protein
MYVIRPYMDVYTLVTLSLEQLISELMCLGKGEVVQGTTETELLYALM